MLRVRSHDACECVCSYAYQLAEFPLCWRVARLHWVPSHRDLESRTSLAAANNARLLRHCRHHQPLPGLVLIRHFTHYLRAQGGSLDLEDLNDGGGEGPNNQSTLLKADGPIAMLVYTEPGQTCERPIPNSLKSGGTTDPARYLRGECKGDSFLVVASMTCTCAKKNEDGRHRSVGLFECDGHHPYANEAV
eukprot:195935-Rhodomonas_salina.2